jgi:hypothetical protein
MPDYAERAMGTHDEVAGTRRAGYFFDFTVGCITWF